MIKRGKRAQFYVIAAVIIIIVAMSMAGISNYLLYKEEPKEFYDLGENLELEGSKIVDYGIALSAAEVDMQIISFADSYSAYIQLTGEKFDLIILYGTNDDARQITCVPLASGETGTDIGTKIESWGISCSEPESLGAIQSHAINLGEDTYTIDLKENENFFFVISKSEGFERYVYQKKISRTL